MCYNSSNEYFVAFRDESSRAERKLGAMEGFVTGFIVCAIGTYLYGKFKKLRTRMRLSRELTEQMKDIDEKMRGRKSTQPHIESRMSYGQANLTVQRVLDAHERRLEEVEAHLRLIMIPVDSATQDKVPPPETDRDEAGA